MPFKNKAARAEWARDWRASNPGYESPRRGKRRQYYLVNRDRILTRNKLYRFLSKYGITPAEYEKMAAAQPACAICGLAATDNLHGKLYPDHCHTTGKVRELLCHQCNIALGVMKDDPELLEKAAAYVRRHKNSLTAG